jgi:hypothetical protein
LAPDLTDFGIELRAEEEMFDMKTAVRLGAVCAFASLIVGCSGGSGTLLDGSSPSPSATTAEQPVNSHWGHWFHQPDTVLVTDGGNGSVTSSPAGIDCTGSSGCSKSFPVGSAVRLSPFATAATVAAGTGGTTGSGGTTSNGSTQASTPATTQASAQQVISPAFYVSPTGSDSNAGTSAGAPFLTLTKCQTAMQVSSTKTCYLMGGTYSLAAALSLTSSDNGENWLAFPGQTPVLDGGSSVTEAFNGNGAINVTVRWLTVQNFTQSGISFQSCSGIFIDSNIVNGITGVSGYGGINLSLGCPNSIVTHNLVENTGYAGIFLSTSNATSGTLISGSTIAYNSVLNTMKTDSDGGGIYLQDQPHLSAGIVVNNNVVGSHDSSANSNSGKGIYLDDYVSNTRITSNIVYGHGTWALMMSHGGNNVTVENNIFDVTSSTKLVLYQTCSGCPGSHDYGMANNVFTDNIVYSSATPRSSQLWQTNISGSDVPAVVGNNLYYDTTETLPYSAYPADTNPTVANPGFVNAAANNYNFTSGAPAISGGSFAPINVSTVGPIPNP